MMLNKMKNNKKVIKIAKFTPWLVSILIILFSAIMSSMENTESQILSHGFAREVQRTIVEFASYSRNATNFELYEAVNFVLRKLAHMFIFYNIFILLSVSFRTLFKSIWISMAVSYVATLLLAILDEVHQIFVSGRTAAFTDVIIDMTGAFFAFLTVFIIIVLNKFVEFLSLGWKRDEREMGDESSNIKNNYIREKKTGEVQ